jgi:serine/threonine protein kinase
MEPKKCQVPKLNLIIFPDGGSCCTLSHYLKKVEGRELYQLPKGCGYGDRYLDSSGYALFKDENEKIFYAVSTQISNVFTLTTNETKKDKYVYPKAGGEGSYGEVEIHKTSGIAVKSFKVSRNLLLLNADLIKEVSIYKLLGKMWCGKFRYKNKESCCVGKLYDVDLENKKIFIELGTGSLENLLDMGHKQDTVLLNKPQIIKPILYRLASCMGKINNQGIIHCDLKPANIIVAPNGIYVIDFGKSEIDRSPGQKHIKDADKQTYEYRSPEIFTHLQGDYAFNYKIDVFSTALIFLDIAYGKTMNIIQYYENKEPTVKNIQKTMIEMYGLTNTREYKDMMRTRDSNIYNSLGANLFFKLIQKSYTYQIPITKYIRDNYPSIEQRLGYEFNSFMNLISGMLNPNPKIRLGWQDVLRHPYFTNIDIKDQLLLEPGYINKFDKDSIKKEWLNSEKRLEIITLFGNIKIEGIKPLEETIASSIQLLDIIMSLRFSNPNRCTLYAFGCYSLCVKVYEHYHIKSTEIIKAFISSKKDIDKELNTVKNDQEYQNMISRFPKYEKKVFEMSRGNLIYPTIVSGNDKYKDNSEEMIDKYKNPSIYEQNPIFRK